jgi:hypothetical protein
MFRPRGIGERDFSSYKERGLELRVALSLHRLGLSGDLLHGLGFASIFGAVSLWLRSAATNNTEARARAERLAIFIGLWPPTFFLLGKVLQDIEAPPEEQARRGRVAKEQSLEEALKPAPATTQ